MSTLERVRVCSTPREAIELLAAELDRLDEQLSADPWEIWEDKPKSNAGFVTTDNYSEPSAKMTVTVDDNDITIDIPPVDEQRRDQRRELAKRLGLEDEFGPSPGDLTWTETYALGGPLWLYAGNHAFCSGLPHDLKLAMVNDVLQDDPKTAEEMGRDLLKGETTGQADALPLAEGDIG